MRVVFAVAFLVFFLDVNSASANPTGKITALTPCETSVKKGASTKVEAGVTFGVSADQTDSWCFTTTITSTWNQNQTVDCSVAGNQLLEPGKSFTGKISCTYDSTNRLGTHTLAVTVIATPTKGGTPKNVAAQTCTYIVTNGGSFPEAKTAGGITIEVPGGRKIQTIKGYFKSTPSP